MLSLVEITLGKGETKQNKTKTQHSHNRENSHRAEEESVWT